MISVHLGRLTLLVACTAVLSKAQCQGVRMAKKQAAELVRFGISIPGDLIARFDQHIGETGYANRSEAIRDLIRNRLVDAAWQAGSGEMIGTFTMVYDHHVRELGDAVTEIQHQHHAAILSTLHIHLDAHLCLEVLVLRGTRRSRQAHRGHPDRHARRAPRQTHGDQRRGTPLAVRLIRRVLAAANGHSPARSAPAASHVSNAT